MIILNRKNVEEGGWDEGFGRGISGCLILATTNGCRSVHAISEIGSAFWDIAIVDLTMSAYKLCLRWIDHYSEPISRYDFDCHRRIDERIMGPMQPNKLP